MVELDAFKKRLRSVLEGRQEEVERVAKVPQSTLSAWLGEKAKKVPPADKLVRVAQARGVTVEWLLTGKATAAPMVAAGIDEAVLARVLEKIGKLIQGRKLKLRPGAAVARVIAEIYAREIMGGESALDLKKIRILLDSLTQD